MSLRNPFTMLRIGLALVFLANALVAILTPQEFKDLVEGSFLMTLFPAVSSAVWVTVITINDSLMFLILFFNIKPILKIAYIWASIWLVGVMVVIREPIDVLEHLGFLSMSLALFLHAKEN